jgi:hypothetical protein
MNFIKINKNFINIFIVIVIIFIILLFNIFFSKTIIETLKNSHKSHKKSNKTEDKPPDKKPYKKPPDMSIDMSISTDFCKSNLGSLKESCSKLTNNNCNMTSCCVVVNGKKCAAGSKNGPTYKTESGKNLNSDYYYYQNKCYGDGCPSKKIKN